MARYQIPLAALVLAITAVSQEKSAQPVPSDQFQKQIDDYLKLRKTIADQLPKVRATPSAQELAERKTLLAANLAKARAGAAQGIVFTPDVAAEFRRLGKVALGGADGTRIRKSLKRAEPVKGMVSVNSVYPEKVPLQSMPPTLLMGLPKLPMELEYRLVGTTLILRDNETNLIVDFLPEAIP